MPLWASTSGGLKPNSWNSGSVTPTPESYSSRHITPTTTGAIVIGRISPTRIGPPKRISRETRSARASPSTVSMATQMTTYFAVVSIAWRKNVSFQISR